MPLYVEWSTVGPFDHSLEGYQKYCLSPNTYLNSWVVAMVFNLVSFATEYIKMDLYLNTPVHTGADW